MNAATLQKFIELLDLCTLPELKELHKYAADQAFDFSIKSSQRALWRAFLPLLKRAMQ